MKKIMVACLFWGVRLCPCAAQVSLLDSFSRVPSGPSTCYSMELLVSIPDTTRPRVLFTWPRVRLGHVFLGLSKASGDTCVVEYLGFYARSPFLAFSTGLPVASRLVNNQGHGFCAGIRVRVTEAAWDTVLGRLRSNASRRYSVLRFNCVHYALEVFNSVRQHPLQPPLATLSGQRGAAYLTPNGLYILLTAMRSGPEGKNIVLRHGWAVPGEDLLPVRDSSGRAPTGFPTFTLRP